VHAEKISTWVPKGQKGGSIAPACNDPTGAEDIKKHIKKQGKKRGPKVTIPWESVHAETKDRLHLAYRKDRSLLLILFQAGRHILCARVDKCGVIAEW
jgi:hypothetical protein